MYNTLEEGGKDYHRKAMNYLFFQLRHLPAKLQVKFFFFSHKAHIFNSKQNEKGMQLNVKHISRQL